MSDKDILARSHAGVRLIALATLYNKGDFQRIRAYMKDHYTGGALDASPIALRLADMREQLRAEGKVRLRQLVAHDKYHVVVLLETQNGGVLLEDLVVEEDYPHKICDHTRQTVV